MNFPIFAIFIFWVMIDFVHSFQAFLQTRNGKKNIVSKDAQYSEIYFSVHEFFFVRFLVFEIWSIFYFTFVMYSGLETNSEMFKI